MVMLSVQQYLGTTIESKPIHPLPPPRPSFEFLYSFACGLHSEGVHGYAI